MKHFTTIWKMTAQDRSDVIRGVIESNISPQTVLEWCRNVEGVDPRHTVETYAYLLEHGDKAFQKRYVTRTGQWRVNAKLEGVPLDQWPLDYVLSVVRGEFGIVGSETSDDIMIRRALGAATGLPTTTMHPKDIIAYAQTYHSPTGPVTPKLTVRGNPIRSLRYMVLRPGEWTRSEQLDMLDGNLSRHKEFDQESGLESIRESLNLPLAWSRDEIYGFLSNDVLPPKTSNGRWVNDVNRQYIPLEHLTVWDIQSFFKGEITLDFTKSELCTEYRGRRGLRDLPDMIIVNQVIAMTESTQPAETKYVTDMMEGFVTYMQKSKGQYPEVAAEAHHTMLNLISRVVRLDYVQFNESMGAILDFIYQHKTDVFAPHRVFGGIAEMNVTSKQYQFYELFMNLLLRTANPATRFSAAKSTGLEELIRLSPIGADLGDKIRNFYKLDV